MNWMKAAEVLRKDICPKWLQLSATARLRIGAIVMVGSVCWCVAAPWLSAHRQIGVLNELDSYWLAGIAFIYGAGNYLQYSKAQPVIRFAAVGISLILISALWFESDGAFFFWKAKSMRGADWMESISYLQSLEKKENAATDSYRALPAAVQRLGTQKDFMNASGQVVDSTNHMGWVDFGYKTRLWGIYRGDKDGVQGHGGRYSRKVGSDVYFFVGARG